jgi:ribosomal protein L37AE/L43A
MPPMNLIFWVLSYVLMIYAIWRSLSRNTYKRYQENRKFLQFFDRLKDRQHRYFDCPKCRQPVRVPRGKGKIAITCPRCKQTSRVPRGKGKIAITCPKCGEKFVRKT